MKNILIVGDDIKEINRLRRFFGLEFKVSAVNSSESALETLKSKKSDLMVYRANTNLNALFELYMNLRRNSATENMPLLVITQTQIKEALSDMTEMSNTAVVDATQAEDDIIAVANSLM
ncbi:MAG: hypothetical protein FWG70_10955 [Oscillospiraceae bacterium]|nr:hypothetical protein [Oscillospiraceae bacterium]